MAQKYVKLSLCVSNYILLKSIKTGFFKANNLIDVVFLEGTVRVRQGLFGVELAELRETVFFRASGQDGLRLANHGVVAGPRLDDGVLQRSRVREGHVPRVRLLVHGVQVQGGVQFGQTARQEHDTGGGRRDARVQHLQGRRGDFFRSVSLRAVGTRANHGRLQQHAVEHDVVIREVLEGFRPDRGGNFEGFFQGVLAVEEDFRLDDRDQTSVLADGGVSRQAVRAVSDGDLGRASRDGDDGSPLAKARALLVVFRGSVGEAVQTLAPGFTVAVRERLQSLVDLDTRVDTLFVQAVDERLASLRGLVEGLLEEDGAANVLTEVRGRDEEFSVSTTVFFGVFYPDAFETGAARGVGFIHRQDTFARLGHVLLLLLKEREYYE